MMHKALNKQLKGDGDADNIDILNTIEPVGNQAMSQALNDLDHHAYVPKVSVQRAIRKERELMLLF